MICITDIQVILLCLFLLLRMHYLLAVTCMAYLTNPMVGYMYLSVTSFLATTRWGYLCRAGLWDKSHLTRQIEKLLETLLFNLLFLLKFKEYSLDLFIKSCALCRYADIYTSRVSNFLYYTPFVYFRSQEQVITLHRSCISRNSLSSSIFIE